MAEKDLRKSQQIETSFIEGNPNQGFQVIEKSEADQVSGGAGGVSQSAYSHDLSSGIQRLNPAAGIIMRIGRGVKSAVGGAVNMLMQSGKW